LGDYDMFDVIPVTLYTRGSRFKSRQQQFTKLIFHSVIYSNDEINVNESKRFCHQIVLTFLLK